MNHASAGSSKVWCGVVAQTVNVVETWTDTTCLACLLAGRDSFAKTLGDGKPPKFFQKYIDRLQARQPTAPDTEAEVWD